MYKNEGKKLPCYTIKKIRVRVNLLMSVRKEKEQATCVLLHSVYVSCERECLYLPASHINNNNINIVVVVATAIKEKAHVHFYTKMEEKAILIQKCIIGDNMIDIEAYKSPVCLNQFYFFYFQVGSNRYWINSSFNKD
jgi:hypothetical protein